MNTTLFTDTKDTVGIKISKNMLTLQSWSEPELLDGSAALDKVDKSPKTYA